MSRIVQFHSGYHLVISQSRESTSHEFPSHRFLCPTSHSTTKQEQERELTPEKGSWPSSGAGGRLYPPHSTPAWSQTPPAAHRRSCPRWWSPWLPPWSTPRSGWWLWCRAWLHRTKRTSKHHSRVFLSPPNTSEAVCRPGCKSLEQFLWASNVPSDAKLQLRAAPAIHSWEFLNSHCWQRPRTSPFQPFTHEGCSSLPSILIYK